MDVCLSPWDAFQEEEPCRPLLYHTGGLEWTMIVAVVTMGVVKMSPDHVIDVAVVRYRWVSAPGTVAMRRVVFAAIMRRGASFRVLP